MRLIRVGILHLETKIGNDNLWYEHKGIMVIKQKDMEIIIKLDMGHNTNK